VPVQINAFGSLLTPFFTSSPVNNYRSATTANTDRYATFFRGMLTRGVYLPPSQFEAWFLSAGALGQGCGLHDPRRTAPR
jgi:glutamate-1-semialdehyde 2,1-aminomutase